MTIKNGSTLSIGFTKSLEKIEEKEKRTTPALTSLQAVLDRITKFKTDRDYGKFNNGKDLAISLNLEASELLEIYQWSGADLNCNERLEKIKEELADVFIYAMQISQHYSLDILDIINDKLTINEEKYPVNLAKGNKKKYNELKGGK